MNGTSSLPPGCREADLHRGASPLDDLTGDELLEAVPGERAVEIVRQFAAENIEEFAEALQEGKKSMAELHDRWIEYRDDVVETMAMRGEIRTVSCED